MKGRASLRLQSAVALTVVVVVAGFPVAWWLIGDLSEPDLGNGLDYNFGRIEIDRRVETTAAVPALLLGLVAMTKLLQRRTRGVLPRGWIVGVAVLTLANVLAAAGGRVLTAGSHGANIGGGMVLMFGGPVLLAAYGTGFALLVRAAQPEM